MVKNKKIIAYNMKIVFNINLGREHQA